MIRANTVAGTFNGIEACNGSADENVAADTDVHGNAVTGCGDDAIETDTVSGINLRIWDNTLDGNFNGFSLAPIYQGPEYVLYNTITDYTRSAFKFSLSGTGHAWICHNTTYSGVAPTSAVWPSGPYSNMHFRDNILHGNGAAPVKDDSGESLTGNDFDGDLLYATGTSTLFRWKSNDYTSLAALRAATGFEAHGTAGDPLFVSPAAGDFRIQSASPAAGAAVVLPGVNDCDDGPRHRDGRALRGGRGDRRGPAAGRGDRNRPRAGRRAAQSLARRRSRSRSRCPMPGGGRLEVVDVAGRRVLARSLDGFAAGNHLLRLDTDARLAPGIYLLRLSHGGRAVTSRVCVIR